METTQGIRILCRMSFMNTFQALELSAFTSVMTVNITSIPDHITWLSPRPDRVYV
jgi:hypothetical protein